MHPQQPGEELPDEPTDSSSGSGDGAEADAWRSIVDNYGERAELAEEDLSGSAAEPEPAPRWTVFPAEGDEPPELADDEPDYDAFVPPEPPPVPRPPADRLLAWLGIFGAPLLLLVFVVAGIHPPQLVSWALIASFIGGFVYLVSQMSTEPRDPGDNGAQL